MDNEIYAKTHKRIRELNALEETDVESMLFGPLRGKYYVVLDNLDENNDVTDAISCENILMLGENRMVPAVNLPSYISAVKQAVDGRLVSETRFETMDGELVPPRVENVYRDVSGSPYKYYRYVIDDGELGPEGKYVSIPVNLVITDGDGTIVNDDDEGYVRSFDLNIGTPTAHAANILKIDGGKLVHTMSGVVPAAGDTKSEPGTQPYSGAGPEFGGTMNIPTLTVDSTGHVNSLDKYTVTVPRTAASTSAIGLVKIESDFSKIQPIGSQSSTGTRKDGDGYFFMAPADHVHTAANIKFTGLPSGTVDYAMCQDKGINMAETLRALPPTPSSSVGFENILNIANASSNLLSTTRWSSVDDYFHNTRFFGTIGTVLVDTEQKEISHIEVPANKLLFVTVHLSFGVSTSSQRYVPYDYTCEIVLGSGNNAQMRTFNIHGSNGAPPNGPMEDEREFSCIFKTGENETTIPLLATIVDSQSPPQVVPRYRVAAYPFHATVLM